MADSQKKSAQLFDKDNAERFEYGLGQNNTVGYSANAAMFCFEVEPNTNYSAKVYGTANTFLRLYRSNNELVKPEIEHEIEYDSMVEQSSTQYPEVTINSGNCQYIWLQVGGNWYTTYGGDTIMLNTGSTAQPYEPYGWLHSLRKLTTATEAVENPLYSDGTAITAYTIKGNEEHTGTPSPQNPVMPNGVGERTENYFNVQNYVANITTHSCTVSAAANGVKITATGSDAYAGEAYKSPDVANFRDSQAAIPVEEGTSYVLSADVDTFTDCYISYLNSSYKALNANYTKIGADVPATFTTPTGTAYIALRLGSKSLGAGQSKTFANIALTKNGLYKIPISSGGVTTNIYLGSTQTVRQIRKVVLNGQENWGKSASTSTFYMNPTGLNVQHKLAISDRYEYTGETKGSYGTFYAPATDLPQFNFVWDTTKTVDEWKAWLADNPVTVWYVRATATTTTVNEPLMKIGDYADTLSNATAIPTTEGANSITVDTTVQPSEFTATWTGWHDAEVKEKSENCLDENDFGLVEVAAGTYRVGTDVGVLPSGTYTLSANKSSSAVQIYRTTKNGSTYNYETITNLPYTFTADGVSNQIFRSAGNTGSSWADLGYTNVMLNTGETAKPYEPYWK